MTTDEALAFLARHQPLPPDAEISKELITAYDEVRRHLEQHPDARAPSLLLNSFGEGNGLGVYQLVGDALRQHDRDDVVEAIGQAIQSGSPGVRSWALDIALEYPDDHLDRLVLDALATGTRDDRYFAAIYLTQRGRAVPFEVIEQASASDDDPELRDAIDALREVGVSGAHPPNRGQLDRPIPFEAPDG